MGVLSLISGLWCSVYPHGLLSVVHEVLNHWLPTALAGARLESGWMWVGIRVERGEGVQWEMVVWTFVQGICDVMWCGAVSEVWHGMPRRGE